MKAFRDEIRRETGRAILDYGMIEAGDRVAVAVSGGKDSLTLLDVLLDLRRRAPVRFDLVAVTVDQGYDGFRWPVMENHFRALGVPHHIERTRIADTIEDKKEPGATWCSLCARLRRGVLYRLAREMGWSKIALGHHADDLIETLLLSQLFNGTIQSMPPILRAGDGVNVVVRPLCYVWEEAIAAYTKERGLPVICCACPACKDLTLKRRRVKALLAELEAAHPGVKRSLLRAQGRLKPTQLMDPRFLPLGRTARLAAGRPAEAGADPEAGEDGGPADLEPAAAPALVEIRRARGASEAPSCGAACACGPLLGGSAAPI